MPPTILAAPTFEPTVAIRHKSDLVPVRGPGVEFVARCHHLLGIWLLFLSLQCLDASLFATRYILFASRFALTRTFTASTLALSTGVHLLKRMLCQTWNSKRARQWRKKVVFEFVAAVLGPGNMLVLFMFWPGWLAFGAALWIIRAWSGW